MFDAASPEATGFTTEGIALWTAIWTFASSVVTIFGPLILAHFKKKPEETLDATIVNALTSQLKDTNTTLDKNLMAIRTAQTKTSVLVESIHRKIME